MKSDILELTDTLDEASARTIANRLATIKGVNKVKISTSSGSLAVDFDEDVTSIQELRHFLQRVGVAVKRSGHSSHGGCCGGCGG